MAVNFEPVFALTPIVGVGQISTANTNRDGTGTIVTIATANKNAGLRIDTITIKATVTNTATVVMLFILDGTNTRLWKEKEIAAVTPSTSVKAAETIISQDTDDDLPFVLPSGYSIGAAPQTAHTFNVIIQGGELGDS
jgi:hypothetical protein